jgi:hypothetical protein
LEYEIRGHVVRIQAELDKQRRPFVWVDGDRVSQDYLNKNDPPDKTPRDERRGPRLLPSHVFAYYSGRNERIEALFQDHQKRFNGRQEITADEVLRGDLFTSYTAPREMLSLEAELRNFEGKTEAELTAAERENLARIRESLQPFYEQRDRFLSSTESEHRRRSAKVGDDRLRRLFYCRGGHSQLVLLACLLSDDPVFKKMLRNLNIESLDSALFVLKEPYRLREKRRNGKFDEVELNEGDRVLTTIEVIGLNRLDRLNSKRADVWEECREKLASYAAAAGEPLAMKQLQRALIVLDLKKRVAYESELSSVAEACIRKVGSEVVCAQVFG